jgi:hypothetical protein
MRGVLFPRPLSASLHFTIIQVFVYLRADAIAVGQLQTRHAYKEKTATNGQTDRQELRSVFTCDVTLCYHSVIYRICISRNSYLDNRLYVHKRATSFDL